MEIKKDKSYFLTEPTDGFEFGTQKKLGTLSRKTGVFLIGEDEESMYFQTIMPIFYGGKEFDMYVPFKKEEVMSKLDEYFC